MKRRYEDQQKSVVAEVMDVASGYADPLLHLGRCISRLDCIVAMAVAAVTAPTQYVRPKMLPSTAPRELTFSQLRHPIVELHDKVNYIPNDVTLSKSSSLHLITGPNMGGKSTYLRSVGCAVLMAQCGSFVSADSATLSVVDSVVGIAVLLMAVIHDCCCGLDSILVPCSQQTRTSSHQLGQGPCAEDLITNLDIKV